MQIASENDTPNQPVAVANAVLASEPEAESGSYRFDLIDQEMLASQVVAIMDAHWCRPDAEQKRDILRRAERQIDGGEMARAISQQFAEEARPEH